MTFKYTVMHSNSLPQMHELIKALFCGQQHLNYHIRKMSTRYLPFLIAIAQIAVSSALTCYDATSYDGVMPSNATVLQNCTSCATSRMEHILYTFVTYQWSCQRGPANAPPVPESQCATMSMESSDKAKTYSQAMCQCCDDLCNKNPCKAWNSAQNDKQVACNCPRRCDSSTFEMPTFLFTIAAIIALIMSLSQ